MPANYGRIFLRLAGKVGLHFTVLFFLTLLNYSCKGKQDQGSEPEKIRINGDVDKIRVIKPIFEIQGSSYKHISNDTLFITEPQEITRVKKCLEEGKLHIDLIKAPPGSFDLRIIFHNKRDEDYHIHSDLFEHGERAAVKTYEISPMLDSLLEEKFIEKNGK